MRWEYKQLQISVNAGWTNASLPDQYISELNKLAMKGWQVDHVIPLHFGMAGTTTVVLLLKREVHK
jgi:hypothetical protein